jgi:hypothetical protein
MLQYRTDVTPPIVEVISGGAFQSGDEFDIVGEGRYELQSVSPVDDRLRFERLTGTGASHLEMSLGELRRDLNDRVLYYHDGQHITLS